MIRLALGVILGTLMGASFTMMLAPRPGRDVRKSVRQKVAEMQEHARLRRRHATVTETPASDL
jgi:gas vesicle protein